MEARLSHEALARAPRIGQVGIQEGGWSTKEWASHKDHWSLATTDPERWDAVSPIARVQRGRFPDCPGSPQEGSIGTSSFSTPQQRKAENKRYRELISTLQQAAACPNDSYQVPPHGLQAASHKTFSQLCSKVVADEMSLGEFAERIKIENALEWLRTCALNNVLHTPRVQGSERSGILELLEKCNRHDTSPEMMESLARGLSTLTRRSWKQAVVGETRLSPPGFRQLVTVDTVLLSSTLWGSSDPDLIRGSHSVDRASATLSSSWRHGIPPMAHCQPSGVGAIDHRRPRFQPIAMVTKFINLLKAPNTVLVICGASTLALLQRDEFCAKRIHAVTSWCHCRKGSTFHPAP